MTNLVNSSAEPRESRELVVLVVDDEESYRDALSSGLSTEGFRVVLARDGFEAMDLFHSEEPDLVLLDVMLPDKSGIEICREIRTSSNVPIIMVSARTTEVSTHRAETSQ